MLLFYVLIVNDELLNYQTIGSCTSVMLIVSCNLNQNSQHDKMRGNSLMTAMTLNSD